MRVGDNDILIFQLVAQDIRYNGRTQVGRRVAAGDARVGQMRDHDKRDASPRSDNRLERDQIAGFQFAEGLFDDRGAVVVVNGGAAIAGEVLKARDDTLGAQTLDNDTGQRRTQLRVRTERTAADDAVHALRDVCDRGKVQIEAQRVQAAGASILRGGAFKPRTSPYSFQGLRAEGLELLQEARKVTGQPIVTELMNNEHIPLFLDAKVDMIQIGARNMQNFELLKAVGKLNVPVLLKRGLSSTLEELVMSAEYIMAEGNPNVVLCERGIRTFETSMRNTLDISAVPMLKKMTHLPVVIDPSHAAGIAFMVPALAQAAVAVGADGLMIETHNDPAKAKSDGAQSLTPDQFDALMNTIKPELEFFGKTLN